jgi:probable phosphoglycerate mutase
MTAPAPGGATRAVLPAGRRRVYLLRHGEVSYFDAGGRPVDPRSVQLTEHGREQARAAGRWLAEVEFDHAACSGMPRARETAALVLGNRALRLEDVPDLRELRAGRFRELAPERREAEIRRAFERAAEPSARFAGGERYADFARRVLGAWRGLLAAPDWRTLLLVAHDAVNRVLLAWAAGAGPAAWAALEQDLGCVNVIDVDMKDSQVERAIVKTANLTPYDPAKLGLTLTSMERVFAAYRPTGGTPR